MCPCMAHAKELAQYGIWVNGIASGFSLLSRTTSCCLRTMAQRPKKGKSVAAHTAMGRFGDRDDLTAVTNYLAADGAGFVSGITLPIDGAYLCDNI